MLDQFTPGDIDLFWADWKLGARAKGKRLTTLRAFFRFCAHRKWIAESPVSPDIKAPVGASKAANKAPFTDEELTRILDACNDVKVEWKNETGLGVWTGEDVKDLIWLMVYTGFRISDATFFNIKRLQGDQVFIRAKKMVVTCLPISLTGSAIACWRERIATAIDRSSSRDPNGSKR
jgi:integrase